MCVRRGQGVTERERARKAAERDQNKTEQNTIYQEGNSEPEQNAHNHSLKE